MSNARSKETKYSAAALDAYQLVDHNTSATKSVEIILSFSYNGSSLGQEHHTRSYKQSEQNVVDEERVMRSRLGLLRFYGPSHFSGAWNGELCRAYLAIDAPRVWPGYTNCWWGLQIHGARSYANGELTDTGHCQNRHLTMLRLFLMIVVRAWLNGGKAYTTEQQALIIQDKWQCHGNHDSCPPGFCDCLSVCQWLPLLSHIMWHRSRESVALWIVITR